MPGDYKKRQVHGGQIVSKEYSKIKACRGGKGIYFALFIVFASAIKYGRAEYSEWQEAHSGIPDLVCCFSVNNNYHLSVVANSSRIDDKEELARQIIHMCQEDAFHTIRFAGDLYGYPSELNITVYMNRKALEKGEAVYEIEFSSHNFREEYDIKNDEDKFHLYVDGKETEFYQVREP